MWKRDLELAGNAGVLAIFRKLRRIPQSRTIQSPIRGNTFGKDDLAMLHALLAGEVMHEAIALVGQPNGTAISRRCDGTSAG